MVSLMLSLNQHRNYILTNNYYIPFFNLENKSETKVPSPKAKKSSGTTEIVVPPPKRKKVATKKTSVSKDSKANKIATRSSSRIRNKTSKQN